MALCESATDRRLVEWGYKNDDTTQIAIQIIAYVLTEPEWPLIRVLLYFNLLRSSDANMRH